MSPTISERLDQALFVVVIGAFAFMYITIGNRILNSSTPSFAQVCEDIVSCKGEGTEMTVNRLDAIESRGRANQHLAWVFGIDNSFTTSNEKRRREFNQIVRRIMRNVHPVHKDRWTTLAMRASGHIARRIRLAEEKGESIMLMPLVQTLTFKMALEVLFGLDSSSLDNRQVEVVATEINRLWMQSKESAEYNEALRFHNHTELRRGLQELLPDSNLDDEQHNPLNFILPAYEAMWRVVMLGYLECCHRPGQGPVNQAERHSEVLDQFLRQPNVLKSGSRGYFGYSAFDIAAEALRLYPSTKRIHRSFFYEGAHRSTRVSANIEALHRDHSVWQNPECFQPERHVDLSSNCERAYMPFGAGLFICPAKQDFGERMIALLIACLADCTKDFHAHIDGEDLLTKDGALPSGRDELNGWELRRG